jgi:hypothetical protein
MTAPKWSVETGNGRYYYHPRKSYQLASVTNIKKVRNVPPINTWKVNTTAKYAAENLERLMPLPENERYRLIKSAIYEPSESGQIGDIVHDWIDRTVKGEVITSLDLDAPDIPKAAKPTFNSFLAFTRYYKPTLNDAEFTVWSDKYGYAGTADLDMTLDSDDGPKRILADTKSGNKAYWDTAIQLAPLVKADFILDEGGNEIPLPQFDGAAILHLRPTYFMLIPVNHIDEHFKAFLGLKAMFDDEILYADTTLGYAHKIKSSTVPMEGN